MTNDLDPEIFQEVEEDLRKENLLKIWKTYGNYIISAALVIVLGVGGTVGWQNYQKNLREGYSDQYAKAQEYARVGNMDGAIALLIQLRKEGNQGYATLAALQHAALILKNGQIEGGNLSKALEEARALYEGMAQDARIDSKFKDLAAILAALIRLDHDQNTVQLTQELQKLTLSTNPWRATASELIAVLAYKSKDQKQAEALYKALGQNPFATDNQKNRAQIMLDQLGNSQ